MDLAANWLCKLGTECSQTSHTATLYLCVDILEGFLPFLHPNFHSENTEEALCMACIPHLLCTEAAKVKEITIGRSETADVAWSPQP